MSKLETSSSAQTSEEPTSKRGLQAAAAAAGAVGGTVEFLGIHLTKGAVRVPEVKETRQNISQMTADISTAKLAILAGVCLYGLCVAGSVLKNIFRRDSGGGNDRGDAGVQRRGDAVSERQLVPVVSTRE